MLPSEPKDVVLRLLDGRSERREMVLRGGRERPPFAVGQESAWRIEAGHVAAAHVMLAFNGAALYVCALPGEKAMLDGEPLGTRWVEAAVPSVLRFGSARLSIGGRAGPEEETQLPAPRHARDEEVTCFDEARLREALAASILNGEITCIAEVEIPAAARRPLPVTGARPVLPDSARTLAAPPAAEIPEERPREDSEGEAATSSMPPTIPSDGLLAVAPPLPPPLPPPPPSFSFGRTFAAVRAEPALARPSSPTIAIPLEPAARGRAGDSLAAIESSVVESSALAVSGENTAGPLPAAAPGPWGRVLEAWQRASRPQRALAILMGPAVIGALLSLRSAPVVQQAAPSADLDDVAVVAPEAAPIAAAPIPAARGAVATSKAPAGAAGAAAATAAERPKTAAVGLHETRTPERRALDTVASGLDSAAADQYEALAAAHPESVAFREAARILRERGATAHR